MKLKDLEIFVVGTPPPGWGGRYWIFVKLTADNGIVGYGEVYASSVGPDAMKAVIEDVFNRHMYNENPENTDSRLNENGQRQARELLRPEVNLLLKFFLCVE